MARCERLLLPAAAVSVLVPLSSTRGHEDKIPTDEMKRVEEEKKWTEEKKGDKIPPPSRPL